MLKIYAKSVDPQVAQYRLALANRVVAQFNSDVFETSSRRLACFLDDEDATELRGYIGSTNRALFAPIDEGCQLWPLFPYYLKTYLMPGDLSVATLQLAFDDLVYLHGSTCANDVQLTISLAHELQHFIQHERERPIWAMNGLIQQLIRQTNNPLELVWADIPVEKETRAVSKRIAEELFGVLTVQNHIATNITNCDNENERRDWQFIQTMDCAQSINLEAETNLLFPRLKPFRSEFEKLFRPVADRNEFKNVNLDALFGS